MAKVVTSHSKYSGVIVSKTDMRKLKSGLDMAMKEVRQRLVFRLTAIGEECVRIARENGSYNDITGNLRSSIGYIVLDDGNIVQQGASKQYSGSQGNGEKGAAAAESIFAQMQAKFPYGVVLVVVAGMNYAAYVESIHHKDVLTSAELLMEQLAKQRLSDLTTETTT